MKTIVTKLLALPKSLSKNRASKELLALTDRQLKDIGLNRYEVLNGTSKNA